MESSIIESERRDDALGQSDAVDNNGRDLPATKRGRGRPKGSKNKSTLEHEANLPTTPESEKRRPGRPPKQSGPAEIRVVFLQEKYGMLPFDSANKPKKHPYLASRQNIRYPALPVHTPEERKFFSRAMNDETVFKEFDWESAAKVWNHEANGTTMFYKTEEQLQSYYTTWKMNTNIKHTIMATEQSRKDVDTLIHHKTRHLHIPPVLEKPMELIPHPTAGNLPPSEQPASASTSRARPLITNQSSSSSSSSVLRSRKRKRSEMSNDAAGSSSIGGGSVADVIEPKRKRSARCCSFCGMTSEGCKGNKKKEYCENPCQDCGKSQKECVGCDSRNRKRLCPMALAMKKAAE